MGINVSDINIPPQNIPAELTLLGCLMMDTELVGKAIKLGLVNTSFYQKEHNLIFRAIVKLYKEKKNIDVVTISEVLEKNNKLIEIGGQDYLREIASSNLSTSGFKGYLDIVLEKSKVRQIGELLRKTKISLGGDVELKDVVASLLVGIEGLDIKSGIEENFQHITYKDKISRAYIELSETDPKKIMKWGWNVWDNMLGGIYGGKIYVIGAETGVGKSTFISQICNNVSKQGYRVVKYALEDRMEDIGKEEIYYKVNRARRKDGLKPYKRTDFVNNDINDDVYAKYVLAATESLMETTIVELDKKKQISIDELIELMERECKKGTKLFAIDHLHYFEMDTGKNQSRHDLQIQNAMHRLNELARKNNVAILLVAHYKLNKAFGQTGIPSYDDFKDGAAIKQVANVIIQLARDIEEGDESSFYITKLRGPIKPKTITASFDLSTFEYSFNDNNDNKKDNGKSSF